MRWREKLARLFARKKKAPTGPHMHINRSEYSAKSLTPYKCPDCKQYTIMVGLFQEWYGWSEVCIRCGRAFEDDEMIPLEFSRYARRDNIRSQLEALVRADDAELIRRTIV